MDKQELFDQQGNSRGYYSKKNRLNDLTGKEWVFWTRSVISKPYPSNLSHALRSAHGGQKPPELCRDIIGIFTKKGQSVLDPFMGVGGVLLGAALCGRCATGIELEQRWIDVYHEVARRENLPICETVNGEAAETLAAMRGRRFDMIFTDVPYCGMDKARRSKGKFKRTGERRKEKPASKLSRFNKIVYESKAAWLAAMGDVFTRAEPLLRKDGYCAVFIGDMFQNGEYHCLSADLASVIREKTGLVWKANLVWYDVSKKLHLYGYQYTYIPSMIHQNIIVFKKEK